MTDLPTIRVPQTQFRTTSNRDPFMLPGERETILFLLRATAASTMTEIGVQEGLGASLWLKNTPTLERYVGVDVEPGYVTSKPSQQTEVPRHPGVQARSDPRFQLILRPRGSLDLTPVDLPPCDLFLIDGDHGAEAVNHDTELAYATVRPGGTILWHDYYLGEGPLDVRTVLNERAARGAPIFHIEGTWLAMERRV